MTRRPSVADYMTRRPMTLSSTLEITRAAALLSERRVSGAPVTDAGGGMVGMLTVKDCFRALLHASYHQEQGGTVSDFMTRDVETIEADLDIVAAAQVFLDRPIRQFPVTDEGRLVGIVNRMDVLAGLLAEFEEKPG